MSINLLMKASYYAVILPMSRLKNLEVMPIADLMGSQLNTAGLFTFEHWRN